MNTKIMLLMVALTVAGTNAEVITITGTVPCSTNISLTNILNTPIFPNAILQLLSGSNTVGNATTNNSGIFSMLVNLPLNLVTSSRLVVTTPLVKCNATLPATGTLVSNLTSAINNLIPSLPVALNVSIGSFTFVA
ncbi:hypothetical protein LUZ60_013920 [Juncus effusus]|nr:hypothetical protein LUZ60_013920 [Juncus effusus]